LSEQSTAKYSMTASKLQHGPPQVHAQAWPAAAL
jgi:hypothetical protein